MRWPESQEMSLNCVCGVNAVPKVRKGEEGGRGARIREANVTANRARMIPWRIVVSWCHGIKREAAGIAASRSWKGLPRTSRKE